MANERADRHVRAARTRRRRGLLSRGLTVYVVLLVIGMLSAVGIFATRSASLAITQAGYYRQMVQTHYVTEYAVHSTLAAIATDPAGYVNEFERQDDTFISDASLSAVWRGCRGGGVGSGTAGNRRCFKFGIESIESRFSGALFEDSTAVATSEQLAAAGSLGRSRVEPRFIVEATDVAQIVAPIAGERATDGPLAFYTITLSASGQVGPPTGGADPDDAKLRSSAVSLESARVQATLGPLPPR